MKSKLVILISGLMIGNMGFPAAIVIPQTGQTSTAPIDTSTLAGADGALQKGVAWPNPRFAAGKQSDGASACPTDQEVIVDNLTGLMWPKNGIIGFEGTDGADPIMQPDYNNTTANLNQMQWSQALTAVSHMNTATTKLCGYSDWRLPNALELETLINLAEADQATWLNSSQGFSDMQSYYYWSSSTSAYYTDGAWIVNFDGGSVYEFSKSDNNYVLPVRGPN